MSEQIIDQVESIATTFDKPAENVIFMKELLVKTKPLKPGIDNFHVAMSKNGGLVAFVKKSSYFIMDSSNPMRDSILCQDLSNEHRFRLKDDKEKLHSYAYKTEKQYKFKFEFLKEVESTCL